jgi:hypothetical protein
MPEVRSEPDVIYGEGGAAVRSVGDYGSVSAEGHFPGPEILRCDAQSTAFIEMIIVKLCCTLVSDHKGDFHFDGAFSKEWPR